MITSKGNDNEADLDINNIEGKGPCGHLMRDDGEKPVDKPDARHRCQKYEPEVEKYVDLQREKYKQRNT